MLVLTLRTGDTIRFTHASSGEQITATYIGRSPAPHTAYEFAISAAGQTSQVRLAVGGKPIRLHEAISLEGHATNGDRRAHVRVSADQAWRVTRDVAPVGRVSRR